jgi:tetratricopeptide (TPR) repeat protein
MELSTEQRVRQAGEMCEQGLWPEVLALAQKWQTEDPKDHRAPYYIGLGLSGLGQFSRAETAYRQALAMDPTDFTVWNHLAELLYNNMRRPAEGVRCLKQALKINPQHKLGWLHLAAMADHMGSHHKVLEYADQALALDPKLVEAYLHKATAARALGKMDVIKDVCNALASLEPENFHRAP